DLGAEVATLLAALAAAGHEGGDECAAAFASAVRYLDENAGIRCEARGAPSLEELDAAVDRLRALVSAHKPVLLKAMACCIDADGKVLPAEAELLRAIAAVFDCPVPPLLSGQSF